MTIWIGTDWHLIEYDKDSGTYLTSDKAGSILNTYKESVNEDDIFIYLGDLTDEYEYSEEIDKGRIKNLISELKGYKILVKGNHDTLDDEFYLDSGFNVVCESISYDNILFTHKPVFLPPDSKIINIHGHRHYEIPSGTISAYQINAYPYCNGTIIDLRTLVAKAKNNMRYNLEDTPEKHKDEIELSDISDVVNLRSLVIEEDVTELPDELDDEAELINDIMFDIDDVKLVNLNKDNSDDPYEQQRVIAGL